MTVLDFLSRLRWLDATPLLSHVEPYRLRIFERFFGRDADGLLRFNLGLFGRAKKNAKTLDLVLASLYALVSDAPVHDSECYILANDRDQAADDLALAKKIVRANSVLQNWLRLKKDIVERNDGRGFLQVLPAGDVVGTHGKTYRLCAYDEIHGYRDWSIFEAMQPDPHRRDAQQWITSYASLFHRPGVPLFDLVAAGKRGDDRRMLFSWYAADHCTDPELADRSPEERANPSLASFSDPSYLAQQQQRLPAHKYRRLHLNLPGLPEGSAYQPEPVMDAIARGVRVRTPEPGVGYYAFVDMSGGSSDDAALAIGHRDANGCAVLDCLQDQGAHPPFDPNAAVARFAQTLKSYRVSRVCGDRYAGETFRRQFEGHGIGYDVSDRTKSELYEALEPLLNGHGVSLLDVPTLEQQLLGLAWRGGRIDHANGEHDDHANAAAGAVVGVTTRARMYWDTERESFVQDFGITV
ncbi:MAG: hypothetical protein FJ202_11315 [Gemmatimonadetes bacterium]|nr:hypothetical protein [Gemmatimonadota bacterium]